MPDIQLTPTAGLVELLWTLFYCASWAFCVGELLAVHRAKARLLRNGINSYRLDVANEDISHERDRVFRVSAYLLAGVIFLATPPPIRPSVSVAGAVVGLLFLAVGLWETAAAHRDRRRRARRNQAWQERLGETVALGHWDGRTERRRGGRGA